MLPPGRGPHPAVAYVTGSGPTTREYLPELQALLLRHGVAVLAYDKRGVGASGGVYPGESPTAAAIDTLARTAAPIEVPPGILTAVVGTPVFIVLLARARRAF